MSKKKFLATALLSVSLLGAGVVSADNNTVNPVEVKVNPAVPNKSFTVDPVKPTESTTTTYYVTPGYHFVPEYKMDKNGQFVLDEDGNKITDGFHYDVNVTLTTSTVKTVDGKEEPAQLGVVANTHVLITVAGQSVTSITDQNGQVATFSLPKNMVVNGDTPVSASFSLKANAAGTLPDVQIKAEAKPQVLSYKEGAVTIKQQNGVAKGTYVVVVAPDKTISAYEITSDYNEEVTFKTGELASGSVVKLYTSKATYDKYVTDFAADSKVKDPASLTYTVSSSVAMYRVYNPNNGEHLYTTDSNEYTTLVALGWSDEGVAWQSATAGDAVYRVYNPNNGDHHYTKDAKEVKTLVGYGWKNEGTVFYSEKNNPTVEVYRLYNPNATGAGSHHYTKDAKEANALKALGWNFEGRAFYAATK